MYIFVHGNFHDAPHALHCVEDCIERGLVPNKSLLVFATKETDERLTINAAPVEPELTEEEKAAAAKKKKKGDEGPVYDPNAQIYWAKLKSLVNVTIYDPATGISGDDELQHVLNGAKTFFEPLGNVVVVVKQASANIDTASFD